MANVGRKWIAPVVIAAAFAASAIAYNRLPSLVTLPAGALLPFDVPDKAEPAPRWMAAFLAPVLSVVIWLGFRFSATGRAQRVGRWFFRNAPPQVTSAEQFERFGETYETIVLGVVALVLGVHAGLLAAVFQRPVAAARIIGVTLALFMIVVGRHAEGACELDRLSANETPAGRSALVADDTSRLRGGSGPVGTRHADRRRDRARLCAPDRRHTHPRFLHRRVRDDGSRGGYCGFHENLSGEGDGRWGGVFRQSLSP